MYPLPSKPKVVILVDDAGKALKVASNIAPVPEFEVITTRCSEVFATEARGTMFNQSMDTGWRASGNPLDRYTFVDEKHA